jgi:hypothetical protein
VTSHSVKFVLVFDVKEKRENRKKARAKELERNKLKQRGSK